eukprot:10208815-Prorocentrum_lima.AAC.1
MQGQLQHADSACLIKQAWEKQVVKLDKAKQPWCCISGPLGAMVQTLRENGWIPVGPWEWVSPDVVTYIFSTTTPHVQVSFLQAWQHTLMQKVWYRASSFEMGH